ncbi:MAG: class IV adenylate cyclase [Phycisphaeraceae bacterium]|nr:class IV adenylate cyclase [Phycisphaeraceae bacterium]MCW5753876.1 class IV adenylate cyclase [Phycisphaeraceae bacterium]
MVAAGAEAHSPRAACGELMHNVEIKLELCDLPLARTLAVALGATPIIKLQQTDTYFRVHNGRLKRRESPGEPIEYVFYDRPDRADAKVSHFQIYSEPEYHAKFGLTPLPIWVVVRKCREVLLLGNVRIHLDRVAHLGDFLEFEAMVTPSCNIARCHETVADLRRALAPACGGLIAVSYADLIASDLEHDAEQWDREAR